MSSIEIIMADITLAIGLLAFIFFGSIWCHKHYHGIDTKHKEFKQNKQ